MQEWFGKLEAWREFYAFAGAAAATLMGLMFVVMSLGQRTLATAEGSQSTRALFTPIVTFFATVIVVTMLMLIPDSVPSLLGVLLAVVSIAGIIYMIVNGAYRFWRTHELGFDDLLWYFVLPWLSYASIGIAAAAIWKGAPFGLDIAAAAMLLLLVIGIRNAWDLVVYSIQRGSS